MGLDRRVEMLVAVLATEENVLLPGSYFQSNNLCFNVSHCSILEEGTLLGVVVF